MSSVGPVSAVSSVSSDDAPLRTAIALEMQKKSVNMQAEAAFRLLAAMLPVEAPAPPPLAEEGPLGTQLNEIV